MDTLCREFLMETKLPRPPIGLLKYTNGALMKTYNYVLLDWDGNLAKTLDIWLDAVRTVLAKHGHHPDDYDIAGSFGAFIQYLTDLGIKDVQATYDEADQIAKKTLPDVQLYPHAIDLLKYLREHHKHVALLTSSTHENIEHLLDKNTIRDLFDVIIAADDVTHHKPHPEPVELALKQLGGVKDEAIIVGDSDKDLGAALNAGIDSLLVYPPEHEKFYDLDELKTFKPTYIVDNLAEVKSIII
jgi:pyrophosphatase PpaX